MFAKEYPLYLKMYHFIKLKLNNSFHNQSVFGLNNNTLPKTSKSNRKMFAISKMCVKPRRKVLTNILNRSNKYHRHPTFILWAFHFPFLDFSMVILNFVFVFILFFYRKKEN